MVKAYEWTSKKEFKEKLKGYFSVAYFTRFKSAFRTLLVLIINLQRGHVFMTHFRNEFYTPGSNGLLIFAVKLEHKKYISSRIACWYLLLCHK